MEVKRAATLTRPSRLDDEISARRPSRPFAHCSFPSALRHVHPWFLSPKQTAAPGSPRRGGLVFTWESPRLVPAHDSCAWVTLSRSSWPRCLPGENPRARTRFPRLLKLFRSPRSCASALFARRMPTARRRATRSPAASLPRRPPAPRMRHANSTTPHRARCTPPPRRRPQARSRSSPPSPNFPLRVTSLPVAVFLSVSSVSSVYSVGHPPPKD